jgi:hypothetical protein
MYGESSDFGPIDLLGSLGVNALTTHVACKNPSLRVGIKNSSGDVPAYADFRFLGGIAAAAVGQFMGGTTTRRVAHDMATGLLGSYIATETCRKNALDRIQEGAPAQISEAPASAPASASAAPAAAEGSSNWSYGW